MLRKILVLLALFPVCGYLQGGMWDSVMGTFGGQPKTTPPTIKVLVLHDVNRARVEVTGKYSLYNPHDRSYISTRYSGKSRDIEAKSDGLKWGEAFPGLYQLKIKPEEPTTFIIVNGMEYSGNIMAYDIDRSTLSIVNQIPVEDYIRYQLADLKDLPRNPEALAALAIAARTNAYYQVRNPKNQYWNVDGSKVGFRGRYPVTSEINQAVYNTRQMVMSKTGVYEGGPTPFPATFEGFLPSASKEAEMAKLSVADVDAMAQRGEHAAQILAKAFPSTSIVLIPH